jgi:ApbE superfamily uncharacterized protein (UPF0280 family)
MNANNFESCNRHPHTFGAQRRFYRNQVRSDHLSSFTVKVKETDLLIHAEKCLERIARELVFEQRQIIEFYAKLHPQFAHTLTAWNIKGPAPLIIKAMTHAGKKVGVGPMAAVAGAIAEFVGLKLLQHTGEVIVENGGDIFIRINDPVIVGLYAGKSPLSMRLGLWIPGGKKPISICTSSGTVGHSLSFGCADAVCVISESCALADAAATAIGNRIVEKKDIQTAIDFGKKIEEVAGVVVVVEDKIGLWGEVEVVPLKKG